MPFPTVFELSSIDGTNGFRIIGADDDSQIGWWATSAGDVNGDGFIDLVLGAPGDDAAYVVFGKATGFDTVVDVADLDGANGFQLANGGGTAGRSVAGAGDINGDGYDDLMVGARVADPNGMDSGAAYVVFGHAGGFDASIDLQSLNGTDGFAFNGSVADDNCGSSVAFAGDVNGDGRDDLIVGASDVDAHRGESYVVFGTASPFPDVFTRSDLDGDNGFRLVGAANDEVGTQVASAGDFNGDGIVDLIIGADTASPHGDYSGAAYIVFGQAHFSKSVALKNLDGTAGFRINGVATNDLTGYSVASAGDVNGDGFSDVIVGAPSADDDGFSKGGAYVVFGHAGAFAATLDLSILDGTNGFKLVGEKNGDSAGESVASAGDVNGDGFADVIVGALSADPHGNASGSSYVVYGQASGFSAEIDLGGLDGNNGFELHGVAADDGSGRGIAAEDIDGDGFSDLIIGARGVDGVGPYSGATYVVYGVAPDTPVTRVGTAASQTLAGGDFDDILRGLRGDDELFGHGGNDWLRGDGGSDIVRGGDGADLLVGGGSADLYIYESVEESTHAEFDTIRRINFHSRDHFDLSVEVSGIDANIASGSLSLTTFDDDLATGVDAAHLGVGYAALFTPDTGDFAGDVFLIVDANAEAGYQAGEDFVIRLDRARHIADLDATDFV